MHANTTGSYNTGLGADALISNTTGNNNTAVGLDALRNLTTTHLNTGIGYYAGENTYNATQSTFLGAQTKGGTGLTNVTAVGYVAVATASNQIMLGNTAVTSVMAAGSFVVYSDGRFKRDIKSNVPGLDFINQLRPVTYHYNIHALNTHISADAIEETKGVASRGKASVSPDKQMDEKFISEKEGKVYTGFIAQEVEEAANKLKYEFSGLHKPTNDKDAYGLSYSDFVVPLVKAVQELSEENKQLKQQLAALKLQVDKLIKQ